ncbi:MAG: hypothetical protein KatS3mg014_2569 [Actinomycetota bacterium]|nr:MAG: hypothetical protein KatS3mg014_2569 [Actinomycetota bacterium]
MGGRYPLPVQEDLRDLLTELLGREVNVGRIDQLAPQGAVADYVTDEGAVAAVVVCDLAFACRAGAAITLIPSPAAEESIAEGALTPALTENLREILNVTARLLNSAQTPHVRLRALHGPGIQPPAEVGRLVAQPADRRSFEVEIQGYGSGRLTFAIA